MGNIESWPECAERETLEETGLKLRNISYAIVSNGVHPPKRYHYVTIFMRGEIDEDYQLEPENTEPHKCEGWEWFNWKKLPPVEDLFWPLKAVLDRGFNLFESDKS